MVRAAKRRKSNFSTSTSLDVLNNTQHRRHTTHNEKRADIWEIAKTPPLETRSMKSYPIRNQQGRFSKRQSNVNQHTLASSPEPDQEQPEPSPVHDQEQLEPSTEPDQEQPESLPVNEPESSPEPNKEQPKSSPGDSQSQESQGVKEEDESQEDYESQEEKESQEENRSQDREEENHNDEEEEYQDDSQGEGQDEGEDGEEEESFGGTPQPEVPLYVAQKLARRGSRHRDVSSPTSSNGPYTTLPRARPGRRRRRPRIVELPNHQGLAEPDPDLKEWLVKTVQNTRSSEDWMVFLGRAFELTEYVLGPMPTSFKDALDFILSWGNLYKDLDNLPADLAKKVSNLRAATFTEIKAILNFAELSPLEYDPDLAGQLVVDLEGYLLPHMAILVILSFKAFNRVGQPASKAFEDSLGILVDCSERIDALRSYISSDLKRQRSWRLGIRAKHFKQALKAGQMRIFLPAGAQILEAVKPRVINGWTQSEETWFRDAWEQFKSIYPHERFILIKTNFADQFLRHTMSDMRRKAHELGLE
ncbi:hypothetical protein N7490_003478 [Penicillium lividum]|nr:hypothetical protein N7490_003478 [Penicillium lividum]